MPNSTEVVKATIMPWKGLFFVVVLFLAVSGVQSCTAHNIEEARVAVLNGTATARNVSCRVESFDAQGKMQLNCGHFGRPQLQSESLALAYATNHKTLVCTLYRGDPPSCKTSKAK